MSSAENKRKLTVNSGMYKHCSAVGGGSGLLSCTCMVVTMVLLIIIPSVAVFVFSVVGPYERFFLVLGCSVMGGISAFDLRRKKALSLQGIKSLKGPISLSVAIFVIIVVTMFYAVAPVLMGQLQQMHGH